MIVEITFHHHLSINQQSQTLPKGNIIQQTLPPTDPVQESIIQQERTVQQPLLQAQTGVHAQSSKMNFPYLAM